MHHPEYESDARRLGPGDVFVQPGEALLLVDPGRAVVLKQAVIHVEADVVHAHCSQLKVALRVVVIVRALVNGRRIAPLAIVERDPLQHHGLAVAVYDLVPRHMIKTACGTRCCGARRQSSEAYAYY